METLDFAFHVVVCALYGIAVFFMLDRWFNNESENGNGD